jgi:hypothetical protein
LEKEIVGDANAFICPHCLTIRTRACGCLGMRNEASGLTEAAS